MTVQVFLSILIFSSTAASLIVEAIKKLLSDSFKSIPTNFIVLIVSIITGCGATWFYYLNNGIPLTAINTVCLFLMGIANWLSAMVGYDKVKQLIDQIGV